VFYQVGLHGLEAATSAGVVTTQNNLYFFSLLGFYAKRKKGVIKA